MTKILYALAICTSVVVVGGSKKKKKVVVVCDVLHQWFWIFWLVILPFDTILGHRHIFPMLFFFTDWEILYSGAKRSIQPFISKIGGSNLDRAMYHSDVYALRFNLSRLCRDEQVECCSTPRLVGVHLGTLFYYTFTILLYIYVRSIHLVMNSREMCDR